MACVVSVNDAQFDAEVLQYPGVVLVDFYTPTCPPCRMVAPVLEQICSEREGKLRIVKVNTDENPVVAVPTFALYQAGKLLDQVTGAKSKDWFENWINTSIAG